MEWAAFGISVIALLISAGGLWFRWRDRLDAIRARDEQRLDAAYGALTKLRLQVEQLSSLTGGRDGNEAATELRGWLQTWMATHRDGEVSLEKAGVSLDRVLEGLHVGGSDPQGAIADLKRSVTLGLELPEIGAPSKARSAAYSAAVATLVRIDEEMSNIRAIGRGRR
jgi:hypothetical protein